MTIPQMPIYHLPSGRSRHCGSIKNNNSYNSSNSSSNSDNNNHNDKDHDNNNYWNRCHDHHRSRRVPITSFSGMRAKFSRSASKGRLVVVMAILFAMSSLLFDGDGDGDGDDVSYDVDDAAVSNALPQPHRSLGENAIFEIFRSDSSFSSSSSSSSIPSFLTYQQDPREDPSDPPSALSSLLHAMSLTPGHPSLSPSHLPSSYLYAPPERHSLLRAAYLADPLALPSAYTSLLPRSVVAELRLPTRRAVARALRPYDDRDVIRTLQSVRQFGFLLRFSGKTGRFSVYTHKSQGGVSHRARAIKLHLGPILKTLYPDRFAVGSDDFAVVISGGDSVKLHCDCFTVPFEREDLPQYLLGDVELLKKKKDEERRAAMEALNKTSVDDLPYSLRRGVCNRYDFAPIWQFGSGFVNPEVVPTSVTFPVWSQDLECFKTFVVDKTVCGRFREWDEATNPKGIYFGKHHVEIDLTKEVLERHSWGRVEDDGRKTPTATTNPFSWRGEHNPPPRQPFRPFVDEAGKETKDENVEEMAGDGHEEDGDRPSDRDDDGTTNAHAAEERTRRLQRSEHTLRVPIYPHLRPQLMWRGTDFSYLGCFPHSRPYHTGLSPEQVYQISRNLPRRPQRYDGQYYNATADITKDTIWEGLNDMYERGTLGPRWRAVVMSLRAEEEALESNREKLQDLFLRQQNGVEFGGDGDRDRGDDPAKRYEPIMPWLSVKFTDKGNADIGFGNVQLFERLGIHVGSTHHMNWEEAAGYKYHIDLGGGGGTTWTGVSSKLALPGVLFHHETSTYDWFHEDLLPWIHYIPVSAGLSDLREKYLWAEAHPREAQAISEAGTAFMRYMGTEEYWERAVERMFVFRLRPYIEAYETVLEKSRSGRYDAEGDKAFLGLAKKMGYPLRKMV